MTALRRWPMVGAVAALLIASFLVDQLPRTEEAELLAADPAPLRSSLSDPAPLTTSWYCAIGSSRPGGFADHSISVTSVSEADATATISILTDEGPGPTVRLELGPYTTQTIDLAAVSSAESAAAVVEIVGGRGLVGHEVATAHGSDSGPCATTVSGQWYLAAGSTRRDSDQYLALLNPFGEDVVLDVSFRTSTRERRPEDLSSFVVPGRTVRVVNVSDYVSIEAVVATSITTIQGRVVVEQLQVANGDLGPVGTALVLATPAPANEWFLPAGRVSETGDQQLVVFNPGEDQAELELYFDLSTTDRRSAYGLSAIDLTVQPGRFESLDLAELLRALQVPLPIEFGVRVVSDNDVPVIVSRSQLYPPVDNSLVGAEDSGSTVEVEEAASDAPMDPAGETAADPDTPGASESLVVPIDPSTIERRDPLGGSLLRQDDEGHSDIPEDQLVTDAMLHVLDDDVQLSATTGLAFSPGSPVLAREWLVPHTRVVPDGGSVLLITAVEDALVTVRGMVDGQLLEAERVAIDGETRRVVPILLPVPRSALLITSSSPIAVETQTVDADGVLTVGAAVPLITR